MAAKTCLLCGKPLSRIWAGTGEDFCSREHRNQYRLRRGMDRLLEASKHASVMRRREVPRQIAMAQLRAGGDTERRGYPDPRRLGESPPALQIPQTRPASTVGLPRTGRFLRPIANSAAERIALAAPAAFPLNATAAIGAGPEPRLEARVAPAPPANPAAGLANTKTRPRIAAAERERRKAPAALPPRAVPHPSGGFGAPARKVSAAAQGRALRVSLAAGFRVPEWKLRGAVVPRPEIAGMRWPGARALDAASAPAQPDEKIGALTIAPAGMRIPAPPPPGFGPRFRWPEAMPISTSFVNMADGQRFASAPFGSPDESSKERR